MKSENLIEIKNVSKKFFFPKENSSSLKSLFINVVRGKLGGDEFWALKDVTFDIKKGEFFGIIGRNGSGKSTLLKTMAGIYKNDTGTIDIKGKVSPFLELGVGFNPELTGWENIYLNGAILGLSRKEIEEKIPEILEFSELEQFMNQKLKNYSSGMQVRLAFSVAIHAHAEILFIDEVLAVGDLNFQNKCLSVFRKLKEEGRTIVFVSHGMGSVREFCDRVALMHKGKLLDVGNTEKMIYKYEELNVEDFNSERKSKISDNQWGSLDVAIEELKLKKENKESYTFETGDDITLDLELKDNRKDSTFPINVAFTIYQDGVTRVLDINSHREKNAMMINDGCIKLTLRKQNLLPGRYSISVGVYPQEGGQPYHVISEFKSFQIVGSNPQSGILAIKHDWN